LFGPRVRRGFERKARNRPIAPFDGPKARYQDLLIDNNFSQQPSAAPAFAQMTSQLADGIAAKTARLRISAAEFLRSLFRNGALIPMSVLDGQKMATSIGFGS